MEAATRSTFGAANIIREATTYPSRSDRAAWRTSRWRSTYELASRASAIIDPRTSSLDGPDLDPAPEEITGTR